MNDSSKPYSLSVIIPTHQRREMLLRLLRALAEQDLKGSTIEVIVVADGCTDGTSEAVAECSTPYSLRLVEQAQCGQGAARNRGAAMADGDVLVFFDDDTVPAPDFFRSLLSSIDGGADVAVPFVRVADWIPDTLLAHEQRWWDARVRRAMLSGETDLDHFHFMATMMRRSCFEALGGFDPTFTSGGAWGREDTELAHRTIEGGYRIAYRPDVVVDSDCVIDPDIALRRGRDRGRNDVHFVNRHPALASQVLGADLRGARIQRTVGWVVLKAPRSAVLIAPLRSIVTAVIKRGWKGQLLYKIWVLIWAVEWWRGVIEAGGRELAQNELRR